MPQPTPPWLPTGDRSETASPFPRALFWIDAEPAPGWRNMAIDHAMLEVAEQTGALLWRCYRWNPFCLSFGRHEPASRRYDRARIDATGISCVRRPTGGRAVWHARELTYAAAGPLTGDLRSVYRELHATVARAVERLGAVPTLAGDRATPGVGSGPCFAVAVGGEIVVAGRKVVGSAQRRGTSGFLQHGSLLLEDDQSLIRSVQRGAPGDDPDRTAPEAPLSALLGRTVGFSAAAGALEQVLLEAGAERLPGPPNEVLRRASTHYDSYRSDTWTWDR